MRRDWLGNEVTAGSDATVAGIDNFVQAFLAYESGAGKILATADADAGSPLANAYAAMLWLFLESPEGPPKAAPYLARAEAAAPHASERERLVVAALRAWADNDIPRAIALGGDCAARFPRELALAKATQYHHFNIGDAPGMLRVGAAILPHNEALPYAHGMMAFAYEQSHMLPEAEAAARTAIRLKRKEPWAHHAIAHVMLTQGRNAEARAFLDDVQDSWTGLNSFMVTHNWWHYALVAIEQGAAAEALDLFASRIWGVWKEYSQDQIGAVSLLARLELAGVDVGDRWQDVAPYLTARVADTVNPFLSLQYLYGLARAARPEAGDMLANFAAFAANAPDFARPVWREVVLPAAHGVLAHACRDYAAAAAHLLPVLPRLREIGGSHAQRDLFEQMADDALIGSGQLAAAQNRLEQRRAGHPRSAPTLARLAKVYRALGLPHEAERLAARG